jgi:hypothetical protein
MKAVGRNIVIKRKKKRPVKKQMVVLCLQVNKELIFDIKEAKCLALLEIEVKGSRRRSKNILR